MKLTFSSHLLPIRIGDRSLFLPEPLLREYPYWRGVFDIYRTVYINNHDPRLFSFLMQVVMSGDGTFTGEEDNANLVIIMGSIGLALRMGMEDIVKELLRLLQRYRSVRILAVNPHPFWADIPDEYFIFHSEELYRAWLIVHNDPVLEAFVPAESLIRDYWLAIPDEFWQRLTRNFHHEFCEELDNFNARSAHEPDNYWAFESLHVFWEAHSGLFREFLRRQALANRQVRG